MGLKHLWCMELSHSIENFLHETTISIKVPRFTIHCVMMMIHNALFIFMPVPVNLRRYKQKAIRATVGHMTPAGCAMKCHFIARTRCSDVRQLYCLPMP